MKIISKIFFIEFTPKIYLTQTDRFELSSLRKQGSMNVTVLLDSRFRGNDGLFYVVIIVRLGTLFVLKTVSSSYYKSKNLEQAIQSFKEAIRINQDDFDAHFGFSGCYSELGNEEEAMKATKEAVRIRPDYPFAHTALGLNYYNLGRYDEAIETYKHAMELDSLLADTAQTLISNAYAASDRPNSF
jgi:tetratricopeptide (TPR) repeat protein